MNIRRLLLIGWLALQVLALLWARPFPVRAHAILVSGTPSPNTILPTAPATVEMVFSEPVVLAFSRITVLSQAGQSVNTPDLRLTQAGTTLSTSVPPLANGTYVVSWEVLSSVDGHTTGGSFSFGVGIGQLTATAGMPAATTQPTPWNGAARWLNLTGLALLLGLYTFRIFVWQPILTEVPSHETARQLDRPFARVSLWFGFTGLIVLGFGLGLTILAQAGRYDLLNSANLKAWLVTRFGAMWLIRFWLMISTLFSLLELTLGLREGRSGLRGWTWWAGLAVTIGMVVTTAAVSHSAALTGEQARLAFSIDLLHLLAAGIWVGGLLQLGLALWQVRQAFSDAAETRTWLNLSLALNFSALAAGAVGVLLLSGGYLSWQHVGSWTALLGTAYGVTLLVKLVFVLLAFSIAGVNLLLIKPRLESALDAPDVAASGATVRWFQRLVGLEALFALLVLAAAGWLTDRQRGVDAPLLSNQPGKVVVTQTTPNMQVALTLEPALVGQNRFDVVLTTPSGRPIVNANAVSLRFTFLGQSLGSANATATVQGNGHYQLDASNLSLVGPWQVEVAIRRPDSFDVFAPFRLEVGLSGAIHSLEEEGNRLDRLAVFLTRSSGAVTGSFLVLFGLLWTFFLALRAAHRTWQLGLLMLLGALPFWVGTNQLYTFYQEFTPAKFATNPILPDPTSLARGEELYTANCVVCHGLAGRGDGPSAVSLMPPPADFTAGHTDSHPDGDIYYWIKRGIPGSAMPAFGAQFRDEEVWHLVNYVRRLSAQGYSAAASPLALPTRQGVKP